MEMRHERMLRQMNEKKSDQYQRCCFGPVLGYRLGREIE
jgi:hypothetical protein